MSCVLAIDTAGPVVGVAVTGEGFQRTWSARSPRGSDTLLIPAIADLLDGLPTVELVAVTVGPGAFTGLRVGVATALGFAVSLGCSVVCVSSLEARALQAPSGCCLALLDARKARVYAQLFDTSGETPIPLTGPVDAPLSDVLPSAPFLATGEGARIHAELIEAVGGTVDADASRSPALAVAQLGRMHREQAVEPNDVALTYLRDADAKKPVRT